jgi:hypothetical protein
MRDQRHIMCYQRRMPCTTYHCVLAGTASVLECMDDGWSSTCLSSSSLLQVLMTGIMLHAWLSSYNTQGLIDDPAAGVSTNFQYARMHLSGCAVRCVVVDHVSDWC